MYYNIKDGRCQELFEDFPNIYPERIFTMDFTMFIDLFEALTIFCFGLSWPISIRKSYISRTAKGKSLFFEVFLLIGYAFGIMRKLIQVVDMGSTGFLFYLSFFFYILNFIEISIDVALYFRNVRIDRERENEQCETVACNTPVKSAG